MYIHIMFRFVFQFLNQRTPFTFIIIYCVIHIFIAKTTSQAESKPIKLVIIIDKQRRRVERCPAAESAFVHWGNKREQKQRRRSQFVSL